ncbi:histidine kinase [Nonomuraea sp. NPDC049725]|uniref:sensor histidine kinase n=1 Tax=Nonomuraea sp. NPDC049725 TaxID=3154508 RepID=UPI0034272325
MTTTGAQARKRPVRARSRAWALVVCLALVPLAAAVALDADGGFLLAAVIASGLIVTLAALGWAARRSRARQRDYEERLAAWSAERAIAQERLRIARDLHDLTSHGLGVITVRAAASGYLAGPDADAERRRAMLDVERVARETTAELRRMLTLLRTPGDGPAPLRPADTLDALPAVVQDAERHGLIVEFASAGLGDVFDGSGDRHPIGAGAQLTACAVVREALANTLRHAGPTTVRLTVTRHAGALSVGVEDDGPAPGRRPEPEPGAGYGLAGLRERLAAHGGTLEASPAGRGFRLRAEIPLGGRP